MINLIVGLDLMAVLGAVHGVLNDVLAFAGGLTSLLPTVGLS